MLPWNDPNIYVIFFQHFDQFDVRFGKLGGGAPKDTQIRKKVNLDNALYYYDREVGKIVLLKNILFVLFIYFFCQNLKSDGL